MVSVRTDTGTSISHYNKYVHIPVFKQICKSSKAAFICLPVNVDLWTEIICLKNGNVFKKSFMVDLEIFIIKV